MADSATYLSDNPAILTLADDDGFRCFFKKYQLPALTNLGTAFGMGMIITAYMIGLKAPSGESMIAPALIGNLGAVLGSIVSVRIMLFFTKKEYGTEAFCETSGETDDPEVIRQVIAKAADLLKGQSLYFDPDRPLVPGTTVQYYLDDTIFTIVWKEAHHSCVYTFSETKIAHPSQFRRFLAGDAYGTSQQFLTTEMSASVNAVTAASGDFYGYRKIGTVVYRGEVCREDNALDLCMVDSQGNLNFLYAGQAPQGEELRKYIEDNEIRFSISFGPVLIDNGVVKENEDYPVGEIIYYFSRAALCQMDELHYLVATANIEKGYPVFPNLAEFAAVIAKTGCPMAYTLDGGQTATITINDQLVNQVSYGSQRRISDIIYFATALPDGG